MTISNLSIALRGLRLGGMADALEQQLAGPAWLDVPFEDRVAHLVEYEVSLRSNRKIDRILKTSKMRHSANLEDFDFSPSRGLDKSVILSLLSCQWAENGQTNLLITGLTGTGKTWMACAFGNAAARRQLSVGYYRVGRLLEELETSRHDGERLKKHEHLRRLDLLILDDFGLEALSHNAITDLLNVLDDRVGRKSTIMAAQMPVKKWHEYLGGGAIADAIMDRMIHSSKKIELEGLSMRAKHSRKETKPAQVIDGAVQLNGESAQRIG